MDRIKKLFGVLLLMGTATLLESEPPAELETEIVVEESEVIVEDGCSASSISDYVDKYLVRLEKTVPSLVPLDEDFSYDYIVTAKDKIKKVVVEDQIPSGATYVSSSPIAQVDGDTITWTLYNLKKDEIVPLELIVTASEITDFTNCATVTAYPEACLTTTVGIPLLSVNKQTTSDSVLVGSDVLWNLTIENKGTICAKDVVLTDSFSEGINDSDGNSEQVIEIGTLTPGEVRKIDTSTKAVKAGKYCSLAAVSGSNVESVEDEFCFVVLEKGIDVKQKGPKTRFIGKEATYEITVVNTGDIPFEDVVVTNNLPAGSKLLSAPGAQIIENAAIWITDMAAGEEKTFEIELVANKGGTYCNEVKVSTSDFGPSSSASACTEWRGYPALLIEVIDTQDPLIVGEETTYIIQIANQGTAADTNINLIVNMPDGLEILSVSGDTKGTVDKKSITFEPYPVLNAKEIIQYRIVAKAVSMGDLRFKAEMTSDLLKLPVPEEESTQAY